MVVETSWDEQNWPLTTQEESLHCDVCQVLFSHDSRECYLQTGLCEFCDARLNPYPCHDDPLRPGLMVR
jgi:uncharacterized CHY-type Zn-finger protein